MSDTYNLYNLEASFKEYLVAGNQKPVSVRNYLSDIRHFFGWLVNSDSHRLIADSHGSNQRKSAFKSAEINPQLETLLTPTVINNYKNYFITNNLPHKTINRRLSTVRKFCSFCISQGWMKENPAKRVSNVLPSRATLSEAKGSRGTRYDILNQFQQDLVKQNLDSKTVTSYLSDVREFLGLV